MPTRRRLLAAAALAACAGAGAAAWARRERPPVADTGDDGPGEVCISAPTWAPETLDVASPERPAAVPAEARCPVCGMYAARWPRWASEVRYADGHAHFTDSPLCLFHYLQAVPRHARGRRREDVAGVWVQAHDGRGWLPLAEALFVHGSSAAGPMRRLNLPAFASRADAAAFARANGGQVFAAAALQERLPDELQRLAPHREHASPG